MVELVVWLVKLPFVLVAVVLALALGLIGAILSMLGVALTPVLGLGLVILPLGLFFIGAAWLIMRLL